VLFAAEGERSVHHALSIDGEHVLKIGVAYVGRDRVVRGQYVSRAAVLHALDQADHLAADMLPVAGLEHALVESAHKGQPVAVLLGEPQRVAAGGDLHRVERVKPRVHD